MPLEERKARWQALNRAATAHNVDDWALAFLERLSPGIAEAGGGATDVIYMASVA
jgi:trehalose 6-phosphate synthase